LFKYVQLGESLAERSRGLCGQQSMSSVQ